MATQIKIVTPGDMGRGIKANAQTKKFDVDLSVANDGGIQGNGLEGTPLKVKVDAKGPITVGVDGLNVDNTKLAKAAKDGGFKPVATVQLQSAFGTEIGYALLATERVDA